MGFWPVLCPVLELVCTSVGWFLSNYLAFEFSASPELEEGVSRFDLCWLYAYITGQRTSREPELNWITEPPNTGMYQ
jgi:hypothetical protein